MIKLNKKTTEILKDAGIAALINLLILAVILFIGNNTNFIYTTF